VNRQAPWAA